MAALEPSRRDPFSRMLLSCRLVETGLERCPVFADWRVEVERPGAEADAVNEAALFSPHLFVVWAFTTPLCPAQIGQLTATLENLKVLQLHDAARQLRELKRQVRCEYAVCCGYCC